MKILSLFDGISGAQVALKNLGIIPELYIASEININAIKITQAHFPKTVQVGDIQDFYNSGKFKKFGKFDLIIWGSPCTNLSIAKKGRKSLNSKDSGLFYIAQKIAQELNPKYFFMENVASMNQESKDEISKLLGVSSVEINSSEFLPQNRKRFYWTNIQTKEKVFGCKYKLSDILLPFDDIKHLQLSSKALEYMSRKVKDGRTHWDFGHHSDSSNKLSSCIVSNFKKGVPYNVLIDNRFKRVFSRYFHPIECERLQGFLDSYTQGIANTNRYEVLGNSFTVPVIEYFLNQI